MCIRDRKLSKWCFRTLRVLNVKKIYSLPHLYHRVDFWSKIGTFSNPWTTDATNSLTEYLDFRWCLNVRELPFCFCTEVDETWKHQATEFAIYLVPSFASIKRERKVDMECMITRSIGNVTSPVNIVHDLRESDSPNIYDEQISFTVKKNLKRIKASIKSNRMNDVKCFSSVK